MLSRLVRQILQATVYDVAIETPLEAAPRISERLNNNIRFKREDLQPVFSFKLRGAYNRISQLPKSQLERGVITASAGKGPYKCGNTMPPGSDGTPGSQRTGDARRATSIWSNTRSDLPAYSRLAGR